MNFSLEHLDLFIGCIDYGQKKHITSFNKSYLLLNEFRLFLSYLQFLCRDIDVIVNYVFRGCNCGVDGLTCHAFINLYWER